MKVFKSIYKFFYKLFYPRIKIVKTIKKNPDFNGLFKGIPFFPVIYLTENTLKNSNQLTELMIHELTHYRQYLRTCMLWELLILIKKFKYEFELEAYAYQLKYIKIKYPEMFSYSFSQITSIIKKDYFPEKSIKEIGEDLGKKIINIDLNLEDIIKLSKEIQDRINQVKNK